MGAGRRAALVAAVLVVAACDRVPVVPVVIDLAAGGAAVANGRPVALAVEAGAAGVPPIQLAPGEPLDFYVRLPRNARLVLGLAPGSSPDALAVSVREGRAEPTRATLRNPTEDGTVEAPLDGFAAGAVVRLRLENRDPGPTSLDRLRVEGVVEPRPPLLADGLRRRARPTNVVFVLVDALRADHLSLYGYHRPTTPVLERLAARHGVVFDRAYAPGPSTPNSIPALFTSQPASVLGVNFSANVARTRDVRTVAEAFDLGSMQAAAFVGNPLLIGEFGYTRGFGTYELVRSERGPPHFPPATTLVGRALEYLSVNRDASSFVYVHLMDTHTPFEPVAPHRDRFLGTGGPRPPVPARASEGVPLEFATSDAPDLGRFLAGGTTADQADPDRYDEAIAMVDEQIGTLVEGIAALGLAERTAVVVTADHGEALGVEDDGRRLHGHALFEELVHVPLLLWIPWAPGGQRIADVVSLTDLAPTLVDLVGAPVPASFAGRSLFAAPPPLEPPWALFERLEAQWTEERVFGAGRYGVAEWGFREGPWKLLVEPTRVRLFDLETDPKETRDVAAVHPHVVGYLAQRLGHVSPSALRREPAPLVDPRRGERLEEALRALGYVR